MQPHIKTLVISSIVTLFILASFASASTEDGTSFFPKIGGQNQSAQLANIPDSTSGDSEGGILSGILNFFGNLFTGGGGTSDLTSADKNTDGCAPILANASQNRPDPKDKRAMARYARQQNLATMVYIDCVTTNSNTSRVGSGLDVPNLPDPSDINIDNLLNAPTTTPTSTDIIIR